VALLHCHKGDLGLVGLLGEGELGARLQHVHKGSSNTSGATAYHRLHARIVMS
jgi:hypothetical protein